MRIELSTTYRHFLPAHEAVGEIYGMGFDKMQLGAAHKEADIEKVKRMKEDLRLKFSMHAPFPNPEGIEVNPKSPMVEKDLIFQSIENAHRLGADPIVFHPGSFDVEEVDMDEYYNLFGEFADRASDYGLTLCVENKGTGSNFGNYCDQLLKILDRVGSSNLKICFDSSHARTILDDQDEVIEFFERIKDKVGAIHLVDTGSEKDEHLPPSYGKVMVEKIVSICDDMDYTGPLTFEVTHVPEDMVIDAHRYMREVIVEKYL